MGDHVDLPSLDGVGTDLGINLVITPAQAAAKVSDIMLVAAAREPQVMKQLLEGVQKAKAAKMSAESILGIFEKTIGKALDIVL